MRRRKVSTDVPSGSPDLVPLLPVVRPNPSLYPFPNVTEATLQKWPPHPTDPTPTCYLIPDRQGVRDPAPTRVPRGPRRRRPLPHDLLRPCTTTCTVAVGGGGITTGTTGRPNPLSLFRYLCRRRRGSSRDGAGR